MIKRFYQGILGLKYSWLLTLMAVITLVLAFLETSRPEGIYRTLLMVWLVPMIAFLIFYYYQKFSLRKALNQVENIEQYEKGGMVKNTYILEDRMLVGYRTKVKEVKTTGIKKLIGQEKAVEVIGEQDSYIIETLSLEETRRLLAFLKRKNPEAVIENIEPKGEGSLKELGASN